jgi:hypothetical protein
MPDTPTTRLLTTPVKTNLSRSRSSTTTSNLLVSPSLLRIASSSSTSTVRVSKSHAGQSGLKEDQEEESGPGVPVDPSLNLGTPGPSNSSSQSPSLVQRTSEKSLSVRSRSRGSSPGSVDGRSSPVSAPIQAVALGDPGLKDARIGLKRLMTSEAVASRINATPPALVIDRKGKRRGG